MIAQLKAAERGHDRGTKSRKDYSSMSSAFEWKGLLSTRRASSYTTTDNAIRSWLVR